MKRVGLILLLCLMEKSMCMQDTCMQDEDRHFHYRLACAEIAKKRQNEFEKFKEKCSQSSIVDIHPLIEKYENMLDRCRLQNERTKKDILGLLQQSFKASDEEWNDCMNRMKSVKSLSDIWLIHGFEGTVHDCHADMGIIINLLHEYRINPKAINIRVVNNLNEGRSAANMRAPMPLSLYKYGTMVVDNRFITPGVMNIAQSMFSFPQRDRMATYAHEIGHLIKKHSCEQLIINQYSFNKGVSIKKYLWNHFIRIQEAEAELTVAFKNAYVANLLLQYRQNNFYPKYLFVNHYLRLSKIADCWNRIYFLKEELQKR